MTRNRIAAALVAGLSVLLIAQPGLGKPPDLPLNLDITCDLGSDAPVEQQECFPCPDTCSLAMGSCIGWTIQVFLGQCAPGDVEVLTVMPKVVHRKHMATSTSLPTLDRRSEDDFDQQLQQIDSIAPDADQAADQEARELEELYERSNRLRQQRHDPSCPHSAEECRPDASQPDAAEEQARRHDMARRLYRIAERCRRKGDYEMAYSCYLEVELLVPNSPLGRQARKHMTACQDHLSGAEEAEPDADGATPSSSPKSPSWLRFNVPGLLPNWNHAGFHLGPSRVLSRQQQGK